MRWAISARHDVWGRALELSPADAAYRPAIEQRVMLLDQAIRMMGQ